MRSTGIIIVLAAVIFAAFGMLGPVEIALVTAVLILGVGLIVWPSFSKRRRSARAVPRL